MSVMTATASGTVDFKFYFQPRFWGAPQFFHDFKTTATPSLRTCNGKLQVSAAWLCKKFGIERSELVAAVVASGRWQRSMFPTLDVGLWLSADDIAMLIKQGMDVDAATQGRIMRLLGA